ncbi:hypothetical protein CVV26_02610, partial [Candidatus Kuenenbacteria bacterium HGW-Kuenenbacteria-1]
GNLGEEALPILKKMIEDEDYDVRISAAQALGNFGEKILPILKKMIEDEDSNVRRTVAQTLGNLGEKALPILKKMIEDEDLNVRKIVAQALGNFGEEALSILEKMVEDEDYDVRISVAQALGNLGEEALPILKKMIKDKHFDVRISVAQALSNLGEKALPILKKMIENEDPDVLKEATQAKSERTSEIENRAWQLSTKKPSFATIFDKGLSERILKIEKIVEKLKKEYKENFIGLVIFGSTSKGYYTPESDLDWGIIAKNKEVSTRFINLASSLSLCGEHYAGVDNKNQIKENKETLYYGLFFGDSKKLLEIQKETFKTLDKKEWDAIRKNILENETNLEKAGDRFFLEEEKLDEIKQSAALLRVPPSYEEMLKIWKN